MFGSLLAIAIYLTVVFIPVLIPATVHAVHAVHDGRVTFLPRLAALPRRFPRPFPRGTVARRVAAPASA